MLAKRTVSEQEYGQWFNEFNKARSSIQDREKKLDASY